MTTPTCPWCGQGRLRVAPFYRALQCDSCRTGTVDLTGPARIACCVPGCRATRGDRKGDPLSDGMEWICSRHWATVPTKLKRWRAAAKRLKRRGQVDRAWRINRWLWRECKRAAIERAMGLR